MDILIITRFCIRTPTHKKKINFQNINNIYLRLYLLETFALPSIINQTHENFKWIILIDEMIPAIVQKRIKYLSKKYNNIYFKYHYGEDITNINFYLEYLDNMNNNLLTISLDDDHAIAPDYLSFLKRIVDLYLQYKNAGIVSFNNGFTWNPSKIHLYGSLIPIELTSHNAGLAFFQKKVKYDKVVTFFIDSDIKKKIRMIEESVLHYVKSKSLMFIMAKHSKQRIELYSCNRYKRYYSFFFGDKKNGLIHLNQMLKKII